RVAPNRPERRLERTQRGIELCEPSGKLAFCATLVEVRVPAGGVEHRHLRSVLLTKEPRRCSDELGVPGARFAAFGEQRAPIFGGRRLRLAGGIAQGLRRTCRFLVGDRLRGESLCQLPRQQWIAR